MRGRVSPPLGGQPLASASPARRHDLASTFRCHARAETVATLAYELARLISPLHVPFSASRVVGKEDAVLE